MNYFLKIAWVICLCGAAEVAAQGSKQVVVRYVEAPRDIILQAVAFQPDCPVKFEELRYLISLDGGRTNSYRLRNIGTKPIRSVSVASTNGSASGFSNDGKVLMMPGELMPDPKPVCKECVKTEIVPLTDELRGRFGLKGETRSMVIFMVTEVEFMDGTKFSDQARFDKIQEFIFKISDVFEEYNQQKTKKPNRQ